MPHGYGVLQGQGKTMSQVGGTRLGGRQGSFVGGHPGMQFSGGELHPLASAGVTVLLGCVSLVSLGLYNKQSFFQTSQRWR